MIRSPEIAGQQPMELLEPSSSSNLYRIVWQRKSLVILALVIAMVLGSLYFAHAQPVYKSDAKILIIRKAPPVVSENAVTSYVEDYLATHSQILVSPMIITQAVANKDLKSLSMFAGMDETQIIRVVNEGLNVVRDSEVQGGGPNRGSSILSLSFRGGEPLESMRVLEAIISSYKDYLDKQYQDTSTQLLEHLRSYDQILQDQILRNQAAMLKHIEDHPFLDAEGNEIGKMRAAKRLSYENNIVQTAMKAQNLRIRLEKIERALDSKDTGAAILLLAMEYTRNYGDRTSNNFATTMNDRIFSAELDKLMLESEVGPNHPTRKRLDMRLAAMKEYGTTQEDATKNQQSTRDNALLNSLNAQKLELETLIEQEKYWREQLAILKSDARSDAPNEMKYKQLIENNKRFSDQYDAITAKVRDFDLKKDQGGLKAEVIFPPQLGSKVEPRAFVVFFISGFLGLLGGIGLAYLADVTDKSFRSPEEIRRRLNLPVLGHIPSLLSEEEEKAKADGVAGPDPILVTYYKSKSRKAEVFRAVRTALYFNTRGEGHKVIQITSPNMGDGKTTLSTNLSVSVAQSGKRIVLVDADFRRPRIHKVFGAGNEVGFTTVLTGQCELREAIQPSAIPGLSLLSSGPTPPNPAELLTSPRFKDLIDELREQFDFVIVDTPPLLVVTDPCVVAPRVDGVLLCIRVAKNGRPVAERAREVLTSLGANVLGVVVNGVSLFGQSYGYGYASGYQYGQYDYGTQYQYKYEYYDRYYAPYDDYYNERDEAGGGQRRPAPATPAVTAPPAANGEEKPEGGGFLNRLFGKK